MKPLKWLKDYFNLNQRERNGFIVLFACIGVLVLLQNIFPFFLSNDDQPPEVIVLISEKKKLLDENDNTSNEFKLSLQEAEQDFTIRLFPFDPNTVEKEDLKKLGLSEKLAARIINYRNKGGKFYKKEDLRRIYGLPAAQYEKLEPYITIERDRKNFSQASYDKIAANPETAVLLDLNTADSAALDKLPGIGPAFASRIIKFRNSLGGFIRKEQLLEVYGLDTLFYNKFKDKITVDPESIKRLDINKAAFSELEKHPYISYKEAKAIIAYREKHGSYYSAEDLHKIYSLDKRNIKKMAPYFMFAQ